MAPTPIKTWKTTPEDIRVLAALKRARVGKNVSDRVRMGLRALAEKEGITVR